MCRRFLFSNKMVLRGNIPWIQEMMICERRLYGFNTAIGERPWRRFRRIQSKTKVRENMGRTFWWLATEMMEKLLGDTD
jgi:hypothetical protein